jgi:hypothetical protein
LASYLTPNEIGWKLGLARFQERAQILGGLDERPVDRRLTEKNAQLAASWERGVQGANTTDEVLIDRPIAIDPRLNHLSPDLAELRVRDVGAANKPVYDILVPRISAFNNDVVDRFRKTGIANE